MREMAALVCLLAALTLFACGSTPADVRGSNEAARTGATAESGPRTKFGTEFGPISTFDLRVGDCFNSSLTPSIDPFEVLLVACDKSWEFKVLNQIPVDDLPEWPGEGYFVAQIETQCDRETVSAFYPSEDSWFVGDRTVVCLGLP